jgi:hypothetical protein
MVSRNKNDFRIFSFLKPPPEVPGPSRPSEMFRIGEVRNSAKPDFVMKGSRVINLLLKGTTDVEWLLPEADPGSAGRWGASPAGCFTLNSRSISKIFSNVEYLTVNFNQLKGAPLAALDPPVQDGCQKISLRVGAISNHKSWAYDGSNHLPMRWTRGVTVRKIPITNDGPGPMLNTLELRHKLIIQKKYVVVTFAWPILYTNDWIKAYSL